MNTYIMKTVFLCLMLLTSASAKADKLLFALSDNPSKGQSQIVVEIDKYELSDEIFKTFNHAIQEKIEEAKLGLSNEKTLIKFSRVKEFEIYDVISIGDFYFAGVRYVSDSGNTLDWRNVFKCKESKCSYVDRFENDFIDNLYFIFDQNDSHSVGSIKNREWVRYEMSSVVGNITFHIRKTEHEKESIDKQKFQIAYSEFYEEMAPLFSIEPTVDYDDLLYKVMGYRRGDRADVYTRIEWGGDLPEVKNSETLIYKNLIQKLGQQPIRAVSFNLGDYNLNVCIEEGNRDFEFQFLASDRDNKAIVNRSLDTRFRTLSSPLIAALLQGYIRENN